MQQSQILSTLVIVKCSQKFLRKLILVKEMSSEVIRGENRAECLRSCVLTAS